MNTEDLQRFLQCDPRTKPFFIGVYPRDILPKKPDFTPFCFVINSQPSTESGLHWMCVFVTKNDDGIFFCSYGKDPDFYGLDLSRYASNWKHNVSQLQPSKSFSCGGHVIFVLTNLCSGFSFEDILQDMYNKKDKTYNDVIIMLNMLIHLWNHKTQFCLE